MTLTLGVSVKGLLNVVFRRENGIQIVARPSGDAGVEHGIDVIGSDLERLHVNLLLTKSRKDSEGDGGFAAAGAIARNNQGHEIFFSAC